ERLAAGGSRRGGGVTTVGAVHGKGVFCDGLQRETAVRHAVARGGGCCPVRCPAGTATGIAGRQPEDKQGGAGDEHQAATSHEFPRKKRIVPIRPEAAV